MLMNADVLHKQADLYKKNKKQKFSFKISLIKWLH